MCDCDEKKNTNIHLIMAVAHYHPGFNSWFVTQKRVPVLRIKGLSSISRCEFSLTQR